jgi:hypothetical protein
MTNLDTNGGREMLVKLEALMFLSGTHSKEEGKQKPFAKYRNVMPRLPSCKWTRTPPKEAISGLSSSAGQ